MPAPGTLLLLRHGQSVLNAQDRFTGLLDPPLTRAGEDEAADGRRAVGVRFLFPRRRLHLHADTHPGHRPHRPGHAGTPGRAGHTCLGVERAQLRFPRRRIAARTAERARAGGFPLLAALLLPGAPADAIIPAGRTPGSPAFAGLPHEAVKATESLCGVVKRVRILWHQHLRRRLRAGEDVLVIGHGNSLRALCRVLDRLSDAEVEALNIPTGHPLLYRFTRDLAPLVPGGEYLNPLAARTAAALVAAAGGT